MSARLKIANQTYYIGHLCQPIATGYRPKFERQFWLC